MHQLTVGQLYQVRTQKDWVIAEYLKPIPAHSYKYHSFDMNTLRIGNEQVRNVPDSHQWRKVRAPAGDSTFFNFTVLDRGMETRPVTDEALAEIARLKELITKLGREWTDAKKELKDFCG